MAERQTEPNPKLERNPPSNTAKDPDDWVSGKEPMTGAQASYLKTLSEEAREHEAFDEKLTKAEASKRIDMLKAKLGKQRQGAASTGLEEVDDSTPRGSGNATKERVGS
jgi:hypothetical protein